MMKKGNISQLLFIFTKNEECVMLVLYESIANTVLNQENYFL